MENLINTNLKGPHLEQKLRELQVILTRNRHCSYDILYVDMKIMNLVIV